MHVRAYGFELGLRSRIHGQIACIFIVLIAFLLFATCLNIPGYKEQCHGTSPSRTQRPDAHISGNSCQQSLNDFVAAFTMRIPS